MRHISAVKSRRTQSKAFDSLAHTSGHCNGVITSAPFARKSFTSSSSDRLFCTGSVVEVQESQDEVRDLKEPDYDVGVSV